MWPSTRDAGPGRGQDKKLNSDDDDEPDGRPKKKWFHERLFSHENLRGVSFFGELHVGPPN